MATVTTLSNAQGLAGVATPIFTTPAPYQISREINLASAATAKGSALAANDIIEAISVPVGHLIISAGFEVITAQTGSSVLTLDLGVTGVDVDVFVDGFDLVAAVAGDFSQTPAAFQTVVIGKTADTIDLLIASLTTTNTGGVVRVWASLQAIDQGPIKGTLASRVG